MTSDHKIEQDFFIRNYNNITDNMVDVIESITTESEYDPNLMIMLASNVTTYETQFDELSKKDFIFDRIDIRIIFISLYSLVFTCCFCGK